MLDTLPAKVQLDVVRQQNGALLKQLAAWKTNDTLSMNAAFMKEVEELEAYMAGLEESAMIGYFGQTYSADNDKNNDSEDDDDAESTGTIAEDGPPEENRSTQSLAVGAGAFTRSSLLVVGAGASTRSSRSLIVGEAASSRSSLLAVGAGASTRSSRSLIVGEAASSRFSLLAVGAGASTRSSRSMVVGTGASVVTGQCSTKLASSAQRSSHHLEASNVGEKRRKKSSSNGESDDDAVVHAKKKTKEGESKFPFYYMTLYINFFHR